MTGRPFLPALLGFAARIAVEAAFGADLSDITGAGWVWTDITGDVRHVGRVPVTLGRTDNVSTAGAAAFAAVLNNGAGNYTALNPVGANYPDVAQNTPIRERITLDGSTWFTRFQGFADSWNPRALDASAKVRVVELAAYGMLARLAGRKKPVRSPLSASTAADVSCVAAWSLEDGVGSSGFASLFPGATPGTFSGDLTLAAVQLAPGAAPTVQFGTASTITLPGGAITAGGEWSLSWFALIPSGAAGSVVLLRWGASGTVVQWTVSMNVGAGSITTQGVTADGTLLVNHTINPSNFAALLDVGNHWTVAVVNNGGGAGVARLFLTVNPTNQGVFFSALAADVIDFTGTGGTRLSAITVPVDVDLAGYGLGQVGIFQFDGVHPLGPRNESIVGWPGETCTARMTRICTENSINLTLIGSSTVTMGPQPAGTVLAVLRECEATDHGLLYDGVGPGITYQARTQRYNAAAALTLDMGANPPQVSPPFEPTFDKQAVKNLYAVGHGAAAGVIVEKTDGPLGTATIGVEDAQATVNPGDDGTLVDHGGFLLSLGTVYGYRYPTLTLNMRGVASKAADLLAAAGPGYRVTILNPASKSVDLPPDPIDLIVEGWTETTTADTWEIVLNCSPFQPWVIAEIGSSDHGRIGAGGTSMLAAGITATAGSFNVNPGAYPWTTAGGDVPLDINIGGERIRVTNIGALSAGVQPFTVTRSINGVVKAHSINDQVEVWQPAVIGL